MHVAAFNSHEAPVRHISKGLFVLVHFAWLEENMHSNYHEKICFKQLLLLHPPCFFFGENAPKAFDADGERTRCYRTIFPGRGALSPGGPSGLHMARAVSLGCPQASRGSIRPPNLQRTWAAPPCWGKAKASLGEGRLGGNHTPIPPVLTLDSPETA